MQILQLLLNYWKEGVNNIENAENKFLRYYIRSFLR